MSLIERVVIGKDLDYDKVLEAIQKHLGVFWFNNHWLPPDMLEKGVTGSAYADWFAESVALHTGTTSASYIYVLKLALGLSEGYSWGKKRYFGLYVNIGTYTYQYIHLVTGYASPTSSGNTNPHIGFKIINNTLYGTVANGSAESTLAIETYSASVYRRLECVFTPGVECRFYVNGVDKGALTTNLPTGTSYAYRLFHASIYNTEAVDKIIRIYEARILQVQ